MPDLKDYVSVAERVAAATHDLVSIDASPPTMLDGSMGYMRVVVTLKDGRSATGTASFKLDLQGRGAQATNPIEDCETSAVGRALAFLGYHSSRSIASREEVQEAQRREQQQPRPVQGATPRPRIGAQQGVDELFQPKAESAPAPLSDATRATMVTRIRTHMRRAQDFGFSDARKLAVDLEGLKDDELIEAGKVWKARAEELAAKDAAAIPV